MSRRSVCCGCCTALRPHYKRLVDDIFPASAELGLQKNNMEKLTFYALSSPEKLDRIGEYIAQRLMRELNRRRPGFVEIAMDAMDQLLVACHAQSLNLFVESFLKTVQKLLESPDPRMQIRASQSFVKFANIKEDTPSYHLRYDFLVSKFSAMCHDGNLDNEVRMNIRMAGLRGLQGVVRKTVGDDLLESIWEPIHMNKIVPSLIYNMQTSHTYGRMGEQGATSGIGSPRSTATSGARTTEGKGGGDDIEGDTPESLAEVCLRELAGRAPYGKLETVISAVLTHMDNHRLWDPNEFAVQVFRVIMFSIQSKYSQSVIQALIAHLDKQTKSGPRLRTAIADVIAKVISIAAGESVGLSPLEIISSLLTQLRRAVLAVERTKDSSPVGDGVDVEKNDDSGEAPGDPADLCGSFQNKGHIHLQEERYQATLINALGEYANHLPDYQKIEVMKFVMGKIPERRGTPAKNDGSDEPAARDEDANLLLRKILLKSMLKVGTKYVTLQFAQTFQMNLLEPLLRMAVSPNAEIRLLIQHIMHTLVDRHDNLPKLQQLTVNPGNMQLRVEQCSSSDLQFFKKRGPDIFLCLYGALEQPNNTEENIRAVHTTVALLCIEMKGAESQIEALRFLFGVQDVAEDKERDGKEKTKLTLLERFNLHAFVASCMNLLAHLSGLEEFLDYTQHVTQRRLDHSPLLLPPLRSSTLLTKDRDVSADLLFDKQEIAGILQRADIDTDKLEAPYPSKATSQQSWLDRGRSISRKGSKKGNNAGDAASASGSDDFNEGDSFESSSIGRNRRLFHLPGHRSQEVSFEAFKRLVNEPSDAHKEAEMARGREIAKMFQNMTFNELLTRQTSADDLQTRLADIFRRVNGAPTASSNENLLASSTSKHVGCSPDAHESDVDSPFLHGEIEFPELYVY